MKEGSFHGEPVIRSLPGPKNYLVIQKPNDWFGYRDSHGTWHIPRDGLHTDQATMTMWMQFLSGVYDDEFWGCYTHDDEYQFGNRQEFPINPITNLPDLTKEPKLIPVTRDEADYFALDEAIFTEQMVYPKRAMNNLQRAWIYHAVRLGGWVPWNSHNDSREKSGPRWGYNAIPK